MIYGRRIWRIRDTETTSWLQMLNPHMQIDSFSRSYPDTVYVTLSRRVPAAVLAIHDGWYVISAEGVLLTKSRELPDVPLPQISYYQRIPFELHEVGEILPYADIREAVAYIIALASSDFSTAGVDITSFHMLRLIDPQGVAFVFSADGDRETQLYRLQYAITHLKRVTEGSVKEVDLRFEKPVIKW